jgi:hypothetical protein
MLIGKRFSASMFSMFVLTTLCLLSSFTAKAQTPADGAINTSRSNIKVARTEENNAARLDRRIDTLSVQLARASGTERPGEQLQGQVSDISKENGKFSLGLLPAGRYELRLKLWVDSNGDGAVTQSGARMTDDVLLKDVKVTLNGVQGGTITKELALSSLAPDNSQSSAKKTGDLQNQIGGLSSGQQLRVRSQTIAFTADGKSMVSGSIATATTAGGGK